MNGLAHVTGSGLERWRGEPDEVEPRHEAGQFAKPARERRRQMKRRGLLPVDLAGRNRGQPRYKGQQGGRTGHRNGKPRGPLDAEQVDEHEGHDETDGHDRDRHTGQIPLVDCRRRQDRRQPAGRHPTPPVAHPGQIGHHRAVGTEGLRASGRYAADTIGIHQHQLDPSRGGGP